MTMKYLDEADDGLDAEYTPPIEWFTRFGDILTDATARTRLYESLENHYGTSGMPESIRAIARGKLDDSLNEELENGDGDPSFTDGMDRWYAEYAEQARIARKAWMTELGHDDPEDDDIALPAITEPVIEPMF